MPLTTTAMPKTKDEPTMSVPRLLWIIGICIILFVICLSYIIYKNNIDELPDGSWKWIVSGIVVGVALIAYGASAEAKQKKKENK